MARKEWIRPSTAARLRGIRRQAIYYHIDNNRLKTKILDGNVYVELGEVMALKLRRKTGGEDENTPPETENMASFPGVPGLAFT